MKRMAMASWMVVALGMLGGCAVSAEPSTGSSGPATTAAKPSALEVLAAVPHKTESIRPPQHTQWVAIPNPWSQTYGTGVGGQTNTFPFPTPWLAYYQPPGSNQYTVDFYAFFYEHDELAPILTSAQTPAYDGFQWLVVEITTEACAMNTPAGPATVFAPTFCIDSVIGNGRFLVPFTDLPSSGALVTAEQSWLGTEPTVQAAYAVGPLVYELLTDSQGNYLYGTASDNTVHLYVGGGPIASYPYADVHDPRDPPI